MSQIFAVAVAEFRRIFALKPVFSVMILSMIIYSVFYPQPYLNEALRNVPIAVVDRDGTVSSRDFTRRVDATADVAVVMALPDLVSAEREVYARKVSGVLLIPEHFERDLLHGRASPVALYADASYFLIYQRISAGVLGVARAFGAEVEAVRLIGVGVDPALAVAVSDPMPLTAVPLFNPEGGYASYLLPAAFVLLVQQTLLIGVGLLGTLPGADAGPGEDRPGVTVTIVGKMLAYLALEVLILPFYVIALPYLYGLPRLGSVTTILFFAIPFVLAVSTLGLLIAAAFRNPLSIQLVSGAIGLPFFFLAGFSWPVEAMPKAVQYLSHLVPSTSAIGGFVRISQMGALLSDVTFEFLTLWTLTLLYGGLAIFLETRHRKAVSTSAVLPEPVPQS